MRPIRVGTRGSKLALAQTAMIVRDLGALYPGVSFDTVTIRTTGDARVNVPFAAVGTKGMFVKEIEEALLAGEIDFAVHSMKDMPGELTDGLSLAATPPRVDPRDALVSPHRHIGDVPEGGRVGTSSLRRRAQLTALRPDLQVEELRGNLDTRLRKLDEGLYDAILLACAGLERLGYADRIRERLPVEQFVPAPGQGALALEIRSGDDKMRGLLSPLNDPSTADAVRAERAFQAALGAGCTFPVGAHALIDGSDIRFLAMMGGVNGMERLQLERRSPRSAAAELGRGAAMEILERGGSRMLGTGR